MNLFELLLKVSSRLFFALFDTFHLITGIIKAKYNPVPLNEFKELIPYFSQVDFD